MGGMAMKLADIKIPAYLKFEKKKGFAYLKTVAGTPDLFTILRFKLKGSNIDYKSMEYNPNFIELFKLFMDKVQAIQPETIEAAKQISEPCLAIDDPSINTSEHDVMIGRFHLKNHKVIKDKFEFNWNYHLITEQGDICLFFKNPAFFATLLRICIKIKKKKVKYKKPKSQPKNTIPSYLHFFPFRTKLSQPVGSVGNEQVLYAISFPNFLVNLFSQISSLKVFGYGNSLSMDATTGEMGYANFALNALTNIVLKSRKNPKKGFGITGEIFVDGDDSHFKLTIFDVSNEKILYEESLRFKELEIMKMINGSVDCIVHRCGIANLMNKQMLIHESLQQNPEAFLIYLKLSALVSLKDIVLGLAKDKTVVGADAYSTEKMLELFKQGFTKQNDFLVLQMMFESFLKQLSKDELKQFTTEIIKIDSLIEAKQDKYMEFFKSLNLKKGFMDMFRRK